MFPCFAVCRQAVGRRGRGRQDIDLHLLKPAKFRPDPDWALPPADLDSVVHDEELDPVSEWMTYEYRTAHPVLRWLPTKLAEWIGANHSDDLRIPDKAEDKWSATELNNIILNNIVRGSHGHLRTFGGIKWECDLFNGRPKALCYPFNIDGPRFRQKSTGNIQHIGYDIVYDIMYDIVCDIFISISTYRIRYRIRYHIRYAVLPSYFDCCVAGHFVPGCTVSFSNGAFGRLRSVD